MSGQLPAYYWREGIDGMALTVVGAGVHGQVHLLHVVVGMRSRLSPSNRTRDVRIADVELVVVLGERLEMRRLDLFAHAVSDCGHPSYTSQTSRTLTV